MAAPARLTSPTALCDPHDDGVEVLGRADRYSLRPSPSLEPVLRASRGEGLPAGGATNHSDGASDPNRSRPRRLRRSDAASPAAAAGRR